MEKNDQKDQKIPAVTLADLEARERETEGQNLKLRTGLRAGALNGKFANAGKY